MARLGPPTRRFDPLLAIVRRQMRRRFGRDLEPFEVTAHSRPLLLGYGAFELALERAHAVDERLKELAALKAAALVGCEFCLDIGSMLARHAGVSERQLRELAVFRDSDAFDADERLVLELAEAMTRTPADIPDALFERLRDRFSERQLVELAGTIALENYRARFNWAFEIGSHGLSKGAACALPERPAAAA